MIIIRVSRVVVRYHLQNTEFCFEQRIQFSRKLYSLFKTWMDDDAEMKDETNTLDDKPEAFSMNNN